MRIREKTRDSRIKHLSLLWTNRVLQNPADQQYGSVGENNNTSLPNPTPEVIITIVEIRRFGAPPHTQSPS